VRKALSAGHCQLGATLADDKPIDVNALTEQLEKLKNHHKDKSKQQGPLGVHDDL
jgi:hypothetical protein